MLMIKHDGNVFYVSSDVRGETFENKDAIKSCGCRWDAPNRRWMTTDEKVVSKLLNSGLTIFIDQNAKNFIENKQQRKKEILEKSSAVDSTINIPSPTGLKYMPFQKAGIEFINRQKNVLVADEMGLGKTIQAIGYINLNQNIKTILVICPASLKINWKQELEKWLVRKFTISIGDATKKLEMADIVIVNYELAKKYFDILKERMWDLMILDESHYIKSYKAQRTKVFTGFVQNKIPVKGLKDYAMQKILLTGTPIMNRPDELITQLKVLGNELGRNPFAFMQRYAETNNWGAVVGAKNLNELQEKLRTSCMIRREKKDVLLELPDKVRQIITLDIPSIKENKETLEFIAENWDMATGKLRGKMEAFEEISRIRHEEAVEKIPYVLKYIKEMLENESKIVVFAHHHDVLDAIYNAFRDISVIATGKQSIDERNKAVNEFQNNPDVKLFIASIMAMGVGVTLTASSTVLFTEVEWRPGDLTQAEDRLHRIGQKNTVLVQYLVADKSIEAYMIHKILEKTDIIDNVTNKDKVAMEEMKLEDYVKEFNIDGEIEKEKPELLRNYVEDEKSETVLEALRILAGNDEDFAREKNGIGFNGIDADFGHKLANLDKLTVKQYDIAKKILRKYHKQIPEELFNKIFNKEILIGDKK